MAVSGFRDDGGDSEHHFGAVLRPTGRNTIGARTEKFSPSAKIFSVSCHTTPLGSAHTAERPAAGADLVL